MTRYLAAAALVMLMVSCTVLPPLFAAMRSMGRNRHPRPYNGRTLAREASPGYLSRHPNLAAHLADEPTETEEAA